MESLIQMDDLSALVAPDMSTDTPVWCENCQVLRQNIKKLEQEQEQSFVKLKQKIISTDLLIKKYKSKCEDYDIHFKKNEESTKRADKFQRQSEILETQLKATLMETEPLRAAKTSMEIEIKQKNSEITELQNKLIVAEGAQRQYEHLTKSTTAEIEKLEADKRDLNGRIKVLEGGKITKETARELKGEISMLKKENTGLKKNEKRLERKLKSALSKIEELTEKLKECRTMPAERKRKGASGSFLSPLRSPSKSPRVRKASPSSSPKKTSLKTSPKQPVKAMPMNMMQSESENSHIDDDDDDDDDTESLYKFAFSPVMPCLSPLPPSPSCFKHVLRGKPSTRVLCSDDENLSNMADELEHQLFGDFMEEDSKDGKDENVNMTEEEVVKSGDEGVKENADVAHANITKVVVDNDDEGRIDQEKLIHEHISRNTDAVSEIDQHQNLSDHISSNDTECIIKEIDNTVKMNTSESKSKPDKVIEDGDVSHSVDKIDNKRIVKENSVDTTDDKRSLKEDSVDKTENKSNLKEDAVDKADSKRSLKEDSCETEIMRSVQEDSVDKTDSKRSLKEDSVDKTENKRSVKEESVDKTENKKSVKEDPVDKTDNKKSVKERLASSIQILSPTANRKPHPCSRDYMKDKHKSKNEFSSPEKLHKTVNTFKENNNCEKTYKESRDINTLSSEPLSRGDTSEFEPVITEDDSQNKDFRQSETNHSQVPSSKDEKVNESNAVSELDPNVPVECVLEPLVEQVTCEAGDDKKDHRDLVGEIKVNIIEETVPVQLLGKTPPSRNYLTRQQCISGQSDSHMDSDYLKDKTTKRGKQKMDSSFGESEDEISFLQNTDMYTVLQRETPQRASTDPKKLKNIKKKLRSTIKFKDHDSSSSVEHHKEQQHITSAFIKHESRDKHNKEKICDKTVLTERSNDQVSKKKQKSSLESVNDNSSTEEKSKGDEDLNEISETSHESKTVEGIGTIAANSHENSKESESELGQSVNKMNDNVNIDTDIQDPCNGSLGFTDDRLPISPSRQLSTGFVVQSSIERTPSTESPTLNVEIISKTCDKDSVRPRSPLIRQKHVICETISEEAELELGNVEDKKLSDSNHMILGIDDLFAEQEENAEGMNDTGLSGETLIFGIKPDAIGNKTGVNENHSQSDKSRDDILVDDSKDFNIDNIAVSLDMKQRSRNNSSESFSININKPSCSYHHDEILSSIDRSFIDSERIIVTSTSCPTISPHLLTCASDNIDNEHLTLCQSRSSSTTPSICSTDLAMPPLSPLSMSPFDFISPISPLPPSPVRQVDRVSPLSTESVGDTNETVASEQSVTNENEKNVCNVPNVRTPERTVFAKVINDSPIHVPDLISPIRTPKQKQGKKIKLEKGKKVKDKIEQDSSPPITFVSSVPAGVLTVKPKQDMSSLHSSLNTKPGVSAIGKQPIKDISLRKHVALKKSIDFASNLDSVFVRKSRHTINKPKTNDKEKVPITSKKTSAERTEDNFSNGNQLIENEDSDKKVPNKADRDSIVLVDETGDNCKERGVNAESLTDSEGKKCGDQSFSEQVIESIKDSKNIADTENISISYEKSINEMNDTKVRGNVNYKIKSQCEKDSRKQIQPQKLEIDSERETCEFSKSGDKSNNRKSKPSDSDRRKYIQHQLPKHTNSNFSKIVSLNKTGYFTGNQVQKTVHKDGIKDQTTDNKDQEGPSVVSEDHRPDKPEADMLPAGYDPLMASKRKTRMAHQPRTHPVIVKKPPVIIEPFFQPQTTRRKRKSQESTDKDPTPRKQAKQLRGPLFQKQKADKTLDPLRQELSRKLESYLKSNEKMETFCRNVLSMSESKLGSTLIEVCLECIGRFRGDCLDSVYQSLEEENHTNLDDEFPLLNNVEKKAVLLLSHITRCNQKEINTQSILKALWDGIFTKEIIMSMTGKMSTARIFTAVCQQEGNVEQVRVLMYNIAICGYLNHWLFVVPVVSVWPEVLTKPIEIDNHQQGPMLLVYEYLVTKSLLEQDTESSRKVLRIMEKLCNWSGCSEHPEIVLRQLTTGLFELNTEQNRDTKDRFEVVQACKLLLKNETWPWCNEYFINRQGLQPAYNRYMCKKGIVSSVYICAVLELTGFIITCHSEQIKQRELSQICKTWLLSMVSKEEGDPVVQNCCLETLLEMSVFNPSIITDLHVWLKKTPSHSLDRNLHKVEILRQTFKEKFGLACEPYVK